MIKMLEFIERNGLCHADLFPENLLKLFGSDLKAWLRSILEQAGVKEQPVILGKVHPAAFVEGPVFIAENAVVEATAMIKGPCYIGSETEVRHGAYVRGNVYAGKNCVIGHATEVKSAVFCDGAKAGHFAYVGDSILGRNCNLGAGTKLANLKMSGRTVRYVNPFSKELYDSGMKKFGSIIGDEAQTGCNAVLSPGTLLPPYARVEPCVNYLGSAGMF